MSSVKVLRGSLAYEGLLAGMANPVVFQFNPEMLYRRQLYSDRVHSLNESIRFRLILNAMDGLEQNTAATLENGIYPQLAALEELLLLQRRLYRRSWFNRLFNVNASTFLVFGYGGRSIPVMLQRLTVSELLHNTQLEPVHATVDVALRVLTEQDLQGNRAGLELLTAYHKYRRDKAQQIRS